MPPLSGPSKIEFSNSQTGLPLLSRRPVIVVKLLTKMLPTSHPPPDRPATYVEDCNKPPRCPAPVELISLLSKACTAPPPFKQALYPPPLRAMATLGRAETFLAFLSMYETASKPDMFNLPSKSFKGSMVLFLLNSSHDVSLCDRPEALRTAGRVEGQVVF